MSLSASRDWLQLFDHAEEKLSLLHDLLAQKKQLELSHTNAARVKRDIRNQFGNLKDTIATLETSLQRLGRTQDSGDLGDGEFSRRTGVLNNLRARVSDARDEFDGKRANRKARDQLINVKKKKKAEEDEISSNLSNQQLIQEQKQEFEDHEEKLDDILHGVGRLRNMGEDINTELVLHAELLDDLETGIDNTELHIRDGTRRADKIMQKNKSWAGTCTIFVLLAIIVV